MANDKELSGLTGSDPWEMEAEERGDCKQRPVWINMADVEPLEPDSREGRGLESAYRRGFVQGYWRALDDLRDLIGAKAYNRLRLSKQNKFIDTTLHQWRYKFHKGQMESPPRMEVK